MENSSEDRVEEKIVRIVPMKMLHLILVLLAFMVAAATLMELRMTKLEASVCSIVNEKVNSHNSDFGSHPILKEDAKKIQKEVDSIATKLDQIIQNGTDSKIEIAELKVELRILSRKLLGG